MIIRKPYAFLIKNFKKIHIVLLVLSLFVAYKLLDVNSFVSDFMKYETYDYFSNPVSKHVSIFLQLSIVILIVGSISLLFLLMHKQKPWKIYLVPVIEYIVLFFVLNMIKSFFNSYTNTVEATDLRLSRDLLAIFLIAQIPTIIIYIVRVFGLDLKKFNFNSDQEFLELSEADREEFEIGLNFDKNALIRGYRRLLRNLNYFYQEHKLICKTIVGIIIVIIIFQSYKAIFITNKSYKVGDYYSVDGYTFKINHSYYSDKDGAGNIISKKSAFLIVDLSIINNGDTRLLNLEKFHIRSGNQDYKTTNKIYQKEFKDLGQTYDFEQKLKHNGKLDCIIIYKVDNNINVNKFVLFYQERNGHLRKIKLNTDDLSKIAPAEDKELGDKIDIDLAGKKDSISFDDLEFEDDIDISVKECVEGDCHFKTENIPSDGTYKFLEISFSSISLEAKNMIDILNNYGKLKYRNSSESNEWQDLDIIYATSKMYSGKSVFLKVPVEVLDQEILLELLIRNKSYNYKLN